MKLLIYIFLYFIGFYSLTQTFASRHEYIDFENMEIELKDYRIPDQPRIEVSSLPKMSHFLTSRMHDGLPFLFVNRINEKKGYFCIYPKGGSTNLKFLLRVAGYLQPSFDIIINESPHSVPTVEARTYRKYMGNPFVPRVLITRNPYIRLLSGYIDKVKYQQDISLLPPGITLNDTFETFVDKIITYETSQTKVEINQTYSFVTYFSDKPHEINFNDHFRLMSQSCMIPQGMTYDYILPLEQMDKWYEPLVRGFKLEDFVQQGWNITTQEYQGNENQPCFYVSQGKTCETMFDSNSNSTQKQAPKPSNEILPQGHTHHAHNTVQLLGTYYANIAFRAKVTEWIKPDLLQFHYPIWNNESAEEYLSMLK